jgi:hypothetical protein
VQDCAPRWRGESDLRESEAQAAAGMSSKIEIRKSKPANKLPQRQRIEIRDFRFQSSISEFRFSNFDFPFSSFE